MNVPRSRIFVINPKGEVHQHERKQVSSSTYTRIAVDLVDHMFPPLSRPSHPPTPVNSNEKSVLPSIQRSQYAGFTPAEDFSSFTYWYHNIDDSSLDLDKFKPTKDTQRAKPSSNLKEFTSEMKSGGDHKQK